MTISVLVVEDDVLIAKGIEKRLQALKYMVCGLALTGKEAIQMAVELRPDVVLMDINLGSEMDGIDTAIAIQDQTETPVIYLTAHSDKVTIQRAKLTEPVGFVLKPYEESELRSAIEIGLYKAGMDRQLRHTQQWLAATLSSIGDGVIAIDTQGCVSFMNSLAQELTGWRLADALGRKVTEVFNIVEESTRKTVRNPVLDSLGTGQKAILAENTILISRDGSERFIADSAAPIQNEEIGVGGAVLVFRDITEERAQKARQRNAQILEALGQMASGIAHNFNNIMASIVNNVEIFRSEDISPNQKLTAVEQISTVATQAISLTQQFVAFSHKPILIPRLINLNDQLDSMAHKLQELLGDTISLTIQKAHNVGLVKVDPAQFEQVLVNLASNARDAMPSGGRLTIATSTIEVGEASTVAHPNVRPGRYVNLSVADTGTGMDEKVLTHIFEPFFSTKGMGKGIGLGLSAVFGIIKQSGGEIEVTSEIGVGTNFSLFLPQVGEPTTQPNTLEQSQVMVGTETILLVDDEDSVRASVKMLLETIGYTVLDASNGHEAIRIATQYDKPIHVLLTDLTMPKMSGRELAEQLAVIRPETRVLFMSGFTDDDVVRQSVAFEASHVLQKPFSLASLSSSLRKTLEYS
ncbi:MAG: response regulator [Pirellulaceae bacterium]|nr:response regulator [Pirellulaceae bacterium]